MFNDVTVLDPDGSGIDPVTGAPLLRPGSRRSSFNSKRSSGSFVPVPVPVVGYTHPAYMTPQYLTADLLPSPQLVPASWVDAYYDRYKQQPPAALNNQYAPSPRRRTIQLPSPGGSPFHTLVPLPSLPDEPEYQDPRETWASRFKQWIRGETRPDPHRALLSDIRAHGCFYKRESEISWNISLPPHTVRIRYAFDAANESAFDPPLRSCSIVSSLIPWRLELDAPEDKPFITVMSLIADVYDCLKRSIDLEVYNKLPDNFRSLVDTQYRRRCLAIPDPDAAQAAIDRGIKRVDFLLDKIHFAGLAQIKGLHQTFEIQFSAKP